MLQPLLWGRAGEEDQQPDQTTLFLFSVVFLLYVLLFKFVVDREQTPKSRQEKCFAPTRKGKFCFFLCFLFSPAWFYFTQLFFSGFVFFLLAALLTNISHETTRAFSKIFPWIFSWLFFFKFPHNIFFLFYFAHFFFSLQSHFLIFQLNFGQILLNFSSFTHSRTRTANHVFFPLPTYLNQCIFDFWLNFFPFDTFDPRRQRFFIYFFSLNSWIRDNHVDFRHLYQEKYCQSEKCGTKRTEEDRWCLQQQKGCSKHNHEKWCQYFM